MSIHREVEERTAPIHDFLNRRGVLVAEAREALVNVEQLLRTLLSVRGQEGVTLKYWTPGSCSIHRACEEMVDLADELQVVVQTEFNGINVHAHPRDSATILAESYLATRRVKREKARG